MPDWGVETREKWILEQLVRAQVPETISAPVRRLLVAWWEIHHDPEDRDEILFIFTELIKSHALAIPQSPNVAWVPVRPGQIRVADIIRIKLDAYRGELGERHNGRIGKVVAIRSGDIIVNTIDGEPKLESIHHSPYALDKQVPIYS